MDAKLKLTPHGVFANPMRGSMADAFGEINSRLAVPRRLNYYHSSLDIGNRFIAKHLGNHIAGIFPECLCQAGTAFRGRALHPQTGPTTDPWLQRASDAVGMRITSPVLIGFLKLASRYPTGFAARPAAQEGWGLMPAVDPFLFAQAWQDASFERHLFPCTRGELQTLPTRMELFPVDDPFLLVVDRFRKSVRSRWSEWEALFR